MPGTRARHGALHVAGAGARAADRRAHRSVLARRRALPDGDRRAAVPGRHVGGGVRGDPEPRPAAGRPRSTRACRPRFGRILEKALEKDRDLRYQTATELKTDLLRLQRDLDSGRSRRGTPTSEAARRRREAAEKSIAVLYFENLSGVKEDEYFRDGITEDIITELSKIKGLNIFPRPTVLAFRDKPVTPAQVGQQLGAAYVLAGSLRRAGNRLRINAQLVDTRDRLPALVGALRPRDAGRLRGAGRDRAQDRRGAAHHALAAGAGGARRQADREPAGLRPLSARQELRAPADAPGPRVRAADVRERGRARPDFALAYAAIANVCAQHHYHYGRDPVWIDAGAAPRRSGRGAAARTCPRCRSPRPGSSTPRGAYDEAVRSARQAIAAQARLRGRLLPARPRAVRRGPLPGGRGRRRRGARSQRRRTTTSTSRS